MACMMLLGITVTGWGAFAPLCAWGELGWMAMWAGLHGSVSLAAVLGAGVSMVCSPQANDCFLGWEVTALELGKRYRPGFLLPCPGEAQGLQTRLHPQGGWCTLGKVT